MPDKPHSWCNILNPDGTLWCTMFVDDEWEGAIQATVQDMGALVVVMKRTAPSEFRVVVVYRESWEKVEEQFLAAGHDMNQLRFGGLPRAQVEGLPPDHVPPSGGIIGLRWTPAWQEWERKVHEYVVRQN
jgi:hypothetical protein